ncbi:unnamed protein product [Boreogadus saida]
MNCRLKNGAIQRRYGRLHPQHRSEIIFITSETDRQRYSQYHVLGRLGHPYHVQDLLGHQYAFCSSPEVGMLPVPGVPCGGRHLQPGTRDSL